MKLVKTILKHAFTLPQIIIHKIKGVDIPYSQLVTFFRYFPFGRINLDRTVDIKYRKHPVKFYFGLLGPMAAGEFAQRDYDKLPVEGCDVVDIGAAVGDTAIIFVIRGAKKVLGYELNRRYYDIAKQNIELNKFEDKVTLNYCGIASKKINKTDEILGALIPDEDRLYVEEASFKTLDEVVAALDKSSNAVLKMDVDGYEYEILRSTDKKSLNSFGFIAMEYHFGTQDIVSILEDAGFEVTVVPVINVSVNYHPAAFRNMEIGMIYASRIKKLG